MSVLIFQFFFFLFFLKKKMKHMLILKCDLIYLLEKELFVKYALINGLNNERLH